MKAVAKFTCKCGSAIRRKVRVDDTPGRLSPLWDSHPSCPSCKSRMQFKGAEPDT